MKLSPKKRLLLGLCISLLIIIPVLILGNPGLFSSNYWVNFYSNPTTDNLTVDATPQPIQDMTWLGEKHSAFSYETAKNLLGTNLTTVYLTVNQSYFVDGQISYQNFVTDASIRLFSGLGIKAVDTPPFDTAITINITGKPLGEYYVYRDGRWVVAERHVTSTGFITIPEDAKQIPCGAYADLEFNLTHENRETLIFEEDYETSNPLELEVIPRLVDLPMTEAIAPLLVEVFASIWGDRVLLNAFQDPDEVIRWASTKICEKIYDDKRTPVNEEVILALARASLNDESSLVSKGAARAIDRMLWLGGKTSEADLLPEFLPELIQVMRYYGADESWIKLDSVGNIISIDPQAMELFIDKTVTSRNIDTDIGSIPSSLICALSIEALGYIGSPAIPSLSEAVKNIQFERDKGFIYALGGVGTEAIPALLEALNYSSVYVHQMYFDVLFALGNIGQEGIAILVDFLGDQNYSTTSADMVLSRIGSEAVPYLIDALRNENKEVRLKVAYILSEIGPEALQAVPALIELLNDESYDVRGAVIYALEEITGQYFEDQALWLEYWNQQ